MLRLDAAERDYLTNLARPDSAARASELPAVRAGIIKMIERLDDQAAFVLWPRMEVLAGNLLAWALLTDFSARDVGDRSLIRWVLTDPAARALYLEWETVASELVGVLQLEASARPRDSAIADLVGELAQISPDFRQWWSTPRPKGRTSGVKNFQHPTAGTLTIDWEAFAVPDDATQTLFIYTAADEASERALRGLSA